VRIWQRVAVLRHVAHALRRHARAHRQSVVTVIEVRPGKRARRFSIHTGEERG
jgi:hypothetical protein